MTQRTALQSALLGLFMTACRSGDRYEGPDIDAPPLAPTTVTPTLAPVEEMPPAEPGLLWVTRATDDEQEGSLRHRLLEAAQQSGPVTLRFDAADGPFAEPQTITLTRPLPPLPDGITIDGRIEGHLWKAIGVTIDGGDAHPIFEVREGVSATLDSITLTRGAAPRGGGILNAGNLVVRGTTLVGNRAIGAGGAIANTGGKLFVINSTFVDNTAGDRGGGLANLSGTVTVTSCTFSGNAATTGTSLASDGALLVTNTIMADGHGELDCLVEAGVDPASRANLISTHRGCGDALALDPKLGGLGNYNGPTRTIPLGNGSPAINGGDNSAAVDERGEPLVWDQRGNGDPRFVAGIIDIGAFERQAFPDFVVDTLADTDLRACTPVLGDCSLRGALVLANATPQSDRITFEPRVFKKHTTLSVGRPLPRAEAPVTVDASQVEGIVLGGPLGTDGNPELDWVGVTLRTEDPSGRPPAP